MPQSPWPAKMQVETLGGGKIHWDRGEDGKVYVSFRPITLSCTFTSWGYCFGSDMEVVTDAQLLDPAW